MNIFSEIKKSVSCVDACRQYGIELDRHGFAKCPFHSERSASFRAWNGDRGFHCFGCGKHGDVIKLVQDLFDIPFMDACKRLSDDFRLNLFKEDNSSYAQRIAENKALWERRKRQEQLDKEHRELIDEFNAAIMNLRLAQMLMTSTEPTDPGDEFDDYFAIAVRETELARYRADCALEALAEFEKRRFAS